MGDWFAADPASAQNIADRKAALKETQEKLDLLESQVLYLLPFVFFRFNAGVGIIFLKNE